MTAFIILSALLTLQLQPSRVPAAEGDMNGAQPWAVAAHGMSIEARELAQEVAALEAALSAAGYPPLDPAEPDNVDRLAWLLRAGKEQRRQHKDLGQKQALLKQKILGIYTTSAIGDPILSRSPETLLSDADQIAEEYIALLKKHKAEKFEDVFLDRIDQNIRAMKGPYYRQITIMICRHVAIQFPYDRLFELEELDPVDKQQQEWLSRTFTRLRFVDMRYGYRWTSERDGTPRLRPERSQSFDLIEVTY